MIRRIRDSIVIKNLWGIMGLYLLNISVDPADPLPDHIPEDLSFNEQESIIEIIVEKVLGFEDAIKEYDDHDGEQHHKKSAKIDLLVHQTNITENNWTITTEKKTPRPDFVAPLNKGFKETDSPPPKV